MTLIGNWFRRTLNDPQVVLLIVVLLIAVLVISFLADALAPVIAAVVIAFLLDAPMEWLRRHKVRNLLAATAVTSLLIGFVIFCALLIMPPITAQIVQFVDLMPSMISRLRTALLALPEAYPGLITETFVRDVIDAMAGQLSGLGRQVVTSTLTGVTSVITLAVYALLVTVMVFFFLKDKAAILGWLGRLLPPERPLVDQVWTEVVARAGDYARGKVYEILIVGCVSWIAFSLLDLRFPALLAAMTGVSVIVPYVGAAVVTLPVAFVAFFQWGLEPQFFAAVGIYLVIQAFDGNLLAPLLFSEVVKLHPNAIILAILVFGSIWGLWGVFFAIPLATLAHAVIKAWPRHQVATEEQKAARAAE